MTTQQYDNRIKDRTGEKYNKLTFIKPSNRRTLSGHALWQCLCECGSLTDKIPAEVINGKVKSCGCEQGSGAVYRRKYSPLISTARVVFSRYRSFDKRTFGSNETCIDFDVFFAISQQDCFYCGASPSMTYNVAISRQKRARVSDEQREQGYFTYNGLDRIDSSMGHVSNNVVACCAKCNRMKMDDDMEDFISHAKRIASHR